VIGMIGFKGKDFSIHIFYANNIFVFFFAMLIKKFWRILCLHVYSSISC